MTVLAGREPIRAARLAGPAVPGGIRGIVAAFNGILVGRKMSVHTHVHYAKYGVFRPMQYVDRVHCR